MKRALGIVLCGVILTTFSGAAQAAPATKADAKAMVVKAAAFIKANGREKALAEFNNPNGQFTKGELYIVAIDMNGVMLAHPNVKLIGKNLNDLRDSDGTLVNKGFIDTAKSGGGWFNFKWTNPATKTIQAKTTFVQKADDDWLISCGVFL